MAIGSWVLYMLKAVETTASWTNLHIRAIRDLMEHTAEHIRTRAPSIYSYDLVHTIFAQPYTRIAHLTERGIVKRVSASRYLSSLPISGLFARRRSAATSCSCMANTWSCWARTTTVSHSTEGKAL